MNGRPSLSELQECVRTLKWHDLGVQLGLEDSALMELKMQNGNNIDQCRRAMFSMWLSTSSERSRKQLLDALRTKAVNEIYIADQYEKQITGQKTTHGMNIII